MGAARRRGTYEQRRAMAIIREEENHLKVLPVSAKEKIRRYRGQMLLAQMIGVMAGLDASLQTRGKI